VPIVTGSKFEILLVATRPAQRPSEARMPGAEAPGMTRFR
jgi:hypothetical protein